MKNYVDKKGKPISLGMYSLGSHIFHYSGENEDLPLENGLFFEAYSGHIILSPEEVKKLHRMGFGSLEYFIGSLDQEVDHLIDCARERRKYQLWVVDKKNRQVDIAEREIRLVKTLQEKYGLVKKVKKKKRT